MSECPTSDDISLAESNLQDLFSMQEVKDVLQAIRKQAANGSSFNPSEMPDYTYPDPYDTYDMSKLLLCETAEMIPGKGLVITRQDPNDPSVLFDVMSRSENPSTLGTLNMFKSNGVVSTTGVSQFFFKEAMLESYGSRGYKSTIVSKPGNANATNVYPDPLRPGRFKTNYDEKEAHSYDFARTYKGFHKIYHQCFLSQMNHRLTQEAIELNRRYYPSGKSRRDYGQTIPKYSLSFDKFKAVAKESSEIAFKRAMQICVVQREQRSIQKFVKPYAESFKIRQVPKIKDQTFIESFGKRFAPKKNETMPEALPRIQKEYKAHGQKHIDKMISKGGIEVMAQGIAESLGVQAVTVDHIKQATEYFKKARKNPAEFHSEALVFQQVTGPVDTAATEKLLHSLNDGRSSFQRNRKSFHTLGEHLHAHSDGRTRVRKEDKIHGMALAASATLGVPPKALATAQRHALKEAGYNVGEVTKARQQMAKAAGRVKDERGKDTSRDELLKRAEPVQQVKDKPVEPKRGPDDDDGGYTPDGSGGRRRRR